MSETTKVVRIEGGLGLVLPPAAVDRLGIAEGDELLIRLLQRGIEVSTETLMHAHAMEIAERVMKRNATLLRKLAES